MDKISFAVRQKISFFSCNNASPNNSYTLQTYVIVWKCVFQTYLKGCLNESCNHSILSESDVSCRQCWQEWVNNSRYQGQNGSVRSKAIVERKYGVIFRATLTVPDLSLLTMHLVACRNLSNMTLGTRLRERNLRQWNTIYDYDRLLFWSLFLIRVQRRVRLEGCRVRL